MSMNERMKKVFSILLCLCMLVQNGPVVAFAAGTDNLCEHHVEHSQELCGYVAGAAEIVCSHEHTDGCLDTTVNCVHTHGTDGCTYVPGTEAVYCGHVCSAELCGYAAPSEGTSCACVPGEDGTVTHTEGCGYVPADAGTPCGFVHEGCGCAAAVEATGECGHVCSAESGCEKAVYTCGHTEDGSCCYVAAVEAHPCHYVCAECAEPPADETTEPATEATEPATEAATEPVTEAATEATEPVIVTAETTVTVHTAPDVDLPENSEIFALYAEQKLYGYEMATFGTHARAGLNSVEQNIYDALKAKIESVATSGGSTVFTVSSIEGLTTSWTNTDLGVEYITEANVEAAVAAQFDMNKIVTALLNDCPFDLYWYDKTAGATETYQISYSGPADGQWTSATISELTFTFAVAGDFGSGNTVTTDVSKITAAASAANNLVNSTTGSDYEKLVAYKNYICSAVSYNQSAVDNDAPYGAPWQLISVFDGDSSTNVVCEGYSKAFQYLCDLGGLSCISVSGTMSGGTGAGPHMWNVVTLDGKNYLVDVTNCDDGTVGAPDELFMVGGTYTDGGYSYVIGSQTVTYTDCGDLNLSATDYGAEPADPATCTHSFADGKCTLCSIVGDYCGGYGNEQGVWWTYAEGHLTISGTGNMDNYYAYSAPWYQYHPYITSLSIAEGVTTIGKHAFTNLGGIQSVIIPASVTVVEEGAFGVANQETWLTSVTFAEGSKLTTIGESAFSSNPNLKQITLPATVTSIGANAFTANRTMTDIFVEAGNTKYKDINGVLYTADGKTLICCPAGKTVEEYTVPQGVTTIEAEAFFGNAALQTLTLPKSVDAVGEDAFDSCSSLTTVNVPCSWDGKPLYTFGAGVNVNIAAHTVEDGTCTACGHREVVSVEFNYNGGKFVAGWEEADTTSYSTYFGEEVTLGTGSIADFNTNAYREGYILTGWNTEPNGTGTDYGLTGTFTMKAMTLYAQWETCTHGEHTTDGCVCGLKDDRIHSFTKYVDNGDGTHDKVCSVCDYVEVDNEAHTPAENATYTVNADGTHSYTCSSCGNPVTESHTFTGGACTGCGVIGGYCGEEGNEQGVWWTYANGTLTVSGTGAMADCSGSRSSPWWSYADQITTIVVNEGITTIGEFAFSLLEQVTTAKLPDSLTTISKSAFGACRALKTVNLPANLKTIEGWAFQGCYALERVTLPEGLTTIGYRAFSECKTLTSVTVPASVTTIDEGAFGLCPATITVAEDNPNYSSDEHGVLFDKGKTTLMYCRPNIEVETYTIPSTVTEICKEAFFECKNLVTITIPEGVTTIGESAFSECTALTTVTIPAGVTTIEFNTFSGCTSLTTVTIPEGVTTIGNSAFERCTALTTVTILAGVTTIEAGAFRGCTALTTVTIPEGVTTIEESAFYGCEALTTVTIPAGVTTIEAGAFRGCTALATVNVPCTWDGTLYTFDESVTLNKVHNWVEGKCTLCGESCDHSGNTNKPVDSGNGTHSFTCSVCGGTVTGDHSGGTATCTEQAKCEHCGASYGELADHAFADDNATCKYCQKTIVAKVTRDGVVSCYTDIKDVTPEAEINGAVLTVLANITLTDSKALGYMTLERENDATIIVPDGCYLSVNSNSPVTWIDSVGYLAAQKPGGGLEISYRTFEKVSGNPYFLLKDHTVANTSVENGYLKIAEGATLTVTGTMNVAADGQVFVNGMLALGANATVTNSGTILFDNTDVYKTAHNIPADITGGTVKINDVTYTYVSGGSTDNTDSVPYWTCSGEHTGDLTKATCVSRVNCDRCGDQFGNLGGHTIDTATGKCVYCSEDAATATVTDGTTTLYAIGGEQLQAVTEQLLTDGSRTITVVLSEDYNLNYIWTAVRTAVPSENQTVHLTVKGATGIHSNSGLTGLTQLASLSLPDVTHFYINALKDTNLQRLELTAEGDITLEKEYNDSNYIGSVNLVLCCNKASSVTDGVTWNSSTFNSITYTEHIYADGVCTVCNYQCTHTGSTATCTDKAVCTACGQSYGELADHATSYTADGMTITYKCATCDTQTVTYTLVIPTGMVYGSSAMEVPHYTKTGEHNGDMPVIVLKQGEATIREPINAGTYAVTMTWGGQTVSGEYTIAPKELTAEDVTITLSPDSFLYDGLEKLPTVTIKLGDKVLDGGTYAAGYDDTNTTCDYQLVIPYDRVTPGQKAITIFFRNNYSGEAVVHYTITVPEAILSPAAPNGENSWYKSASLLAPDGYAISEAQNGVGTSLVIGDGTHTAITYWLSYVANKEPHGTSLTWTGSIKVDGTAPTVSGTAGSITDSTASVTVTADDALSGVESVMLTCADSSVTIGALTDGAFPISGMQPNTAYTFTLTAKDEAGNEAVATVNLTTEKGDASVAKAPTANKLTYTGTAQNLVNAGSANGGTMVYSLTEDGAFSETVPTGTNAGSYIVWYYVQGDENHSDTAKSSVKVTVFRAPVTFQIADNAVQEGTAINLAVTSEPADVPHRVSFRQNGQSVEAPTAVGEYDVYVAITDSNYRHAASTDGTALKVGVLSIYKEEAPQTYTLSYAAGGAAGTMAAEQAALAGTMRILPESTFTAPKDENNNDMLFAGWNDGTAVYQPGEKYVQPEQNVTMTAVWQAEEHNISGTVKQYASLDSTELFNREGVTITLMLGSRQITQAVTDENGNYTFEHCLQGTYNLIAEYEGIRQTIKVILGHSDQTGQEIALPAAKTNTAVAVQPGTPAVVVGGMDDMMTKTDDTVFTEADKNTVAEGGEVEIKMDVRENPAPAKKDEIDRMVENRLNASATVGLYIDLELTKTVRDAGGKETKPSEAITQSNVLLENIIFLPGHLQGKDAYHVFRQHGNDVEEMKELTAGTEEGFVVDRANNTITIYSMKFSTFAIVTSEVYTVTFDANGGTVGTDTIDTEEKLSSLPTPERSGYKFLGWFTEKTSGTSVDTSTVFTQDTTVYAQWERVGYQVELTAADTTGTIKAGNIVEVDGAQVVIDGNGEIWLENTGSRLMTSYAFATNDTGMSYPTAMYVWNLKWTGDTCKATRISVLDNFMIYKGTSIRINYSSDGIRFFTAVPADRLNKLMNGTLLTGDLEGYKLVEMGTTYMKDKPDTVLTIDAGIESYVYGNDAGSSFRVFSKSGNTNLFTGMLVGLDGNAETLSMDIASRPYAILQKGNDKITIYGGSIVRSVYDVALQNRNTWNEGTDYDNYVEKIISSVEAAKG